MFWSSPNSRRERVRTESVPGSSLVPVQEPSCCNQQQSSDQESHPDRFCSALKPGHVLINNIGSEPAGPGGSRTIEKRSTSTNLGLGGLVLVLRRVVKLEEVLVIWVWRFWRSRWFRSHAGSTPSLMLRPLRPAAPQLQLSRKLNEEAAGFPACRGADRSLRWTRHDSAVWLKPNAEFPRSDEEEGQRDEGF